MNAKKVLVLLGLCQAMVFTVHGQVQFYNKDSSTSVLLSARAQILFSARLSPPRNQTGFEDGMEIRRSQLKLSGRLYPTVDYKFEFAFANADTRSTIGNQHGNTANIVLDAYVSWFLGHNLYLWVGQAKLPGNRERVISSGELQFVDRSLLNALFNIDRDIGVQLHHNRQKVNLIGSVSIGEGRNLIVTNDGKYCYTLRGEFLPFGKFTDEGDYFGADLYREPFPRLSLAATLDYNHGARRERAQLGDFITQSADLATLFFDAHFKYKGVSVMTESVIRRGTPFNDAVLTGEAWSIQAGYLFASDIEIAGRATRVTPRNLSENYRKETQYTIGCSKYMKDHKLKVQTDVSYNCADVGQYDFVYRLQVEVGF